MARAIRPVHHEEHLTLVEHLDELRTRIILSLGIIAAAFAVCFWQHNALLNFLGHPLKKELAGQIAKGIGTQGQIGVTFKAVHGLGTGLDNVFKTLESPSSGLSASARAKLAPIQQHVDRIVAKVPSSAPPVVPTTLGIGEPFTVTVKVAFYFALLVSMPLLLFELYGFVLPAFSPRERAVALPVMMAVPVLFAAGLTFAYEIVLPAAVHFLQGFDTTNYNQLVQASSYYSFSALILLAMGVIFQVPLFVVAVARAGIVTTRQLRHNRRYAIVLAALVAAALPGDAITMTLETVPIVVLYEVGILVTSLLDRRDARRERARQREAAATSTTPPPPPPPIPSNDAL